MKTGRPRLPLVAHAFDDDLRTRMLAAADTLPALLDELDYTPITPPTATPAHTTCSSPTPTTGTASAGHREAQFGVSTGE